MEKNRKTHCGKTLGNRKKLAAFLFFLPFSLCGILAQNRVSGKIKSKNPDLEGIHVINKTTNTATITNDTGYFSIVAASGDTLLFSAVQFREKEIVISETHTDQVLLEVELEERVTELDEVILKNLTGNLDSDLRNAKMDSVNAMSLGLPNAHVISRTQTERRLYKATDRNIEFGHSPNYRPKVSVRTSFLINAISGRTKMLKNRFKRERKKAKLEEIHRRFGDKFFVSSGIAREKIYDFLYFCSVQEEYNRIIKSDDQMILPEFLKTLAIRYREINALDSIPKD